MGEASGAADESLREELVEAATERLNDPQMDAVIAMVDGETAGFCALFEVGDIALVTDLVVTPAYRRRGVATALVNHVLKLARRLLMRVTCVKVPVDNAAAATLFGRCGMEPDGDLTEFVAPRRRAW